MFYVLISTLSKLYEIVVEFEVSYEEYNFQGQL